MNVSMPALQLLIDLISGPVPRPPRHGVRQTDTLTLRGLVAVDEHIIHRPSEQILCGSEQHVLNTKFWSNHKARCVCRCDMDQKRAFKLMGIRQPASDCDKKKQVTRIEERNQTLSDTYLRTSSIFFLVSSIVRAAPGKVTFPCLRLCLTVGAPFHRLNLNAHSIESEDGDIRE